MSSIQCCAHTPAAAMPTPRRRILKPHQRRAIVLLAGCGAEGCTESVMLVHGFTTDQLAGLVRIGLIAKTTERVVSSGQTSEVKRFKLTEAGQQALGDHQ
jgi:hypothetical protein